jgi:hypothetical protein
MEEGIPFPFNSNNKAIFSIPPESYLPGTFKINFTRSWMKGAESDLFFLKSWFRPPALEVPRPSLANDLIIYLGKLIG